MDTEMHSPVLPPPPPSLPPPSRAVVVAASRTELAKRDSVAVVFGVYDDEVLEAEGYRVRVPDGTTAIDEAAFEFSMALVLVALPEGLEAIGRRAFSQCGGLRALTLETVPLAALPKLLHRRLVHTLAIALLSRGAVGGAAGLLAALAGSCGAARAFRRVLALRARHAHVALRARRSRAQQHV